MHDIWQTREYSFSTADLSGCVSQYQPAHYVIVNLHAFHPRRLEASATSVAVLLLLPCRCPQPNIAQTKMCLQVALQIGARVDMALTGPIMWQETETG